MKLSARQKRAAVKCYNRKGIALWRRVGTGKTRIAYKHFAMIAKLKVDGAAKFLVVCRREAFFDWENEAKKCHLDWRFVVVDEEDDLYAKHRMAKPTVYLVSHGMLRKLEITLVGYSIYLDAVAYDEGWLYKNPTTHHCKAANKISAAIGNACILSGSVMTARDQTDIYGQLYAINKHHCLARTLTEFRSKFMYRFKINPDGRTEAAVWRNRKGSAKRIADRVRPIASVYFPSNTQRRVVTDTRRIPASRDQLSAFTELRDFYELCLKGERMLLKNAPSVITKCQQVSDGWVNLNGTPHEIKSAKMDYLKGLVRELLEGGEKVVIWTAFKRSAELVLQSLQKSFRREANSFYLMHGGHKFDVAGWRRNGKVAIATEASGSSVNHFSNCAYAIYYSMSFRWQDLQQSKGRTDRADSSHKTCYYYFLQTRDSLDSMVFRAAHTSGKREAEMIDLVKLKTWLATQHQ